MPQDLVCGFCGESFSYSSEEQAADEAAGYPPPRACSRCLWERHQAAAAKRAAKAPRRKRFRR